MGVVTIYTASYAHIWHRVTQHSERDFCMQEYTLFFVKNEVEPKAKKSGENTIDFFFISAGYRMCACKMCAIFLPVFTAFPFVLENSVCDIMQIANGRDYCVTSTSC